MPKKKPLTPQEQAKRYQTFLNDEEWDIAMQESPDGTLSAGIRECVRKARKKQPKPSKSK